jgi:phosphonopyruvate decarboxylase
MDVSDFGAILKEHGVRSGTGVPCSYFTPLVNQMVADPELDYIPATSEGEAVAIAAGLVAAGRPAFALMQNSGLGNAVNPITSMLYVYQMPVILLVSHRGEPGRSDEPQHKRMGEITEDLIRLCGIQCNTLQPEVFASQLGDMLRRGVPGAWVCRKGTLTGGPKAPPIGLEIVTNSFSPPASEHHAPELSREEALRVVLPLLNEIEGRPAVIATTGKLSRELYELDDREHTRHNRFYMVGSMGCASGFGLGVARARKGKVLVLDGDGAVLMKLGTLATIGATGLTNLHHMVIDNAAHDSTGGQRTVSPSVDIAAVALACGYRRTDTVSTARDLKLRLEDHLAGDGPTLLRMLVHTGARKDLGRPKLAPRDAYLRFRRWLEETA